MMPKPIWPIFFAASQLVLFTMAFIIISIIWHWPYNALPGLLVLLSLQCYGLVTWAAKAEKR